MQNKNHSIKIGELESMRVGLFQQMKRLSSDQLNYSPITGKWSILQIVEHLVLSEELSVGYALAKVSKPEKLKVVNFLSAVKAKVLVLVLRFNIKYKAPSIAIPVSESNISLNEVERRWTEIRILLEKVSEHPNSDLKKGILRHPYTGFMNFSQMMTFIKAHYTHHLIQINRILQEFDEKK